VEYSIPRSAFSGPQPYEHSDDVNLNLTEADIMSGFQGLRVT